jgi:uncharacterized tellurite resistance protein B-like protein
MASIAISNNSREVNVVVDDAVTTRVWDEALFLPYFDSGPLVGRTLLRSPAMVTSDRIFPLCELLLGAAYADNELVPQEKTEIRALLVELAGELRIEVEACIASFEPEKFDPSSVIGLFRDDSEEERQRLLLLVSTVIEADDQIDLAENEYLRSLASALGLPSSALAGLVVDVEIEEIKDTFHAVRKGPPPVPSRA